MLARILISASAVVLFTVGVMHLHGTFFGRDLRPRDPGLEARMKEVSPIITNQTTMWNAWIGFNAILSLGFMLFGVLYGYLATLRSQVLLQDRPLQWVGAIFLVTLVVLARRYLFATPVLVLALSLALYLAGVGVVMI